MGQILRNWRIPTAALFALVLIGGAYVLTRGISPTTVAEASAETGLLQAIASKDSDNDGLPDWQEALYGTDPQTKDSFKLGMTDGEAVMKGLIVPKAIASITVATSSTATGDSINYAAYGLTPPVDGTLTDVFAKNFFSLYLAAKEANGGADLSASATNDIVEQALGSLSSAVTAAPDFKSGNDLTVAGTGPTALLAFATTAEAVLEKNAGTATTSEIMYLRYAVEHDDPVALNQLAAIAKAYRDSAAGLAALAVPQELTEQHLALVNAMMRVSGVVGDFARVTVDPLSAMLALQQYTAAASALADAYTSIANVYDAEGLILPNGTPGASFVNVSANVAARQRAFRTQP